MDGMSFDTLGLSAGTLQAVTEAGYTQPTPIQEKAIPVILSGRDLIGIAQTGTGKTAAFTLPMIDKLASGRAKARMPRTLILEPTRELAMQVSESFEKYGKYQKLSMALLIGGMSYENQEMKIDRGVDVLIATPGRLLDHFERGKLLLTQVTTLIVDEADRMLDMGFIPDVERICKLLPFTRQTLFFSATMAPEITRLTNQFLSNPERIEVSKPATAASTIAQTVIKTPRQDWAKRDLLRHLIRTQTITNGIVFCNRKTDVATLHRSLVKHGFSAGCLHGDMSQPDRLKTLDAFKSGQLQILVASDVAARGLDIPSVSHVFNFDAPVNAEDYVHRIGRTGRAGREGSAFMLVSPEDERRLSAIEKLIGRTIDVVSPEGYAFPTPQEGEGEGRRERSGRGGRDRDRGKGRERGGRRERPRHDEAPAVLEEAGGADTGLPAQEATIEEAPLRRQRAPRRERKPRDPSPAPTPVQQQAEPKRHEPRRAGPKPEPQRHPRPRRDRGDDGDRPVLGMGDHVPAFMLRPPARIRGNVEEAA
jgi:superfamily II DNA/RNA helicase